MEKICVAIRVRPPVTVSEDTTINGTFWKVEENRISLHKSHGSPISGVSYAFGTFVLSNFSLFPL
jgi:centromeric protein E